jgi:hypothetical protein
MPELRTVGEGLVLLFIEIERRDNLAHKGSAINAGKFWPSAVVMPYSEAGLNPKRGYQLHHCLNR